MNRFRYILWVAGAISFVLKTATSIEFSASNLPTVQDNHVQHSDSVILFLYSKSITKIDAKTFEKYTDMSEINLFRNGLTELPGDLFKFNIKLKRINLFNNNLLSLDKNLLLTLNGLEEFNIFNNRIKEIDEDFFRNNRELQKIDMDSNYIRQFQPDTFKYLTKLVTLSCANNRLIEFEFSLVASAIDLEFLYLNENEINELSQFEVVREHFPKLGLVNVHENKFNCSYFKSVLDSFVEQNIKVDNINIENGVKYSSVYGLRCVED